MNIIIEVKEKVVKTVADNIVEKHYKFFAANNLKMKLKNRR